MATGTGVLDVGRRDHIVLFYRDEQDLTERVREYLLPAIHDGGVAIVVATPEHRRSFEESTFSMPALMWLRLVRAVFTLRLTQARRCAASWSVDRPDPAGFWQAVSPILRQAAEAGRPVRVFGEMVWLLWDAGQIDAAIEVEAMWNELGAQYPFSLLCAYLAQPAVVCSPT